VALDSFIISRSRKNTAFLERGIVLNGAGRIKCTANDTGGNVPLS
jgi:hypothetical protein